LLCSYVGFGGPCLLMGWLADRIGEATALTWGVGVVAVAFTTLLVVVRARPKPTLES